MIGDCETAALVHRSGSIDWLCWPRFDSDACFAALLGNAENGRWLICPDSEITTTSQRYRDGTLILETEFRTPAGAAVLIDFMPLRDGASNIVRLVVGREGRIDMRMELIIRFGYGVHVPWVHRSGDALTAIAGPDLVSLRTPVTLRPDGFTTVSEFTVEAGQTVPFVLAFNPSHVAPANPIDAASALAATEKSGAVGRRGVHPRVSGPMRYLDRLPACATISPPIYQSTNLQNYVPIPEI